MFHIDNAQNSNKLIWQFKSVEQQYFKLTCETWVETIKDIWGVNRMGKKPGPDFESKVSLKINDISIELNEFTEDVIREVSFGMVRAIKTANLEIRNLKIEIDNEWFYKSPEKTDELKIKQNQPFYNQS